MREDEVKDVVRQAVRETLVEFGVDVDDPSAMRRDLTTLREWREAVGEVRRKALTTLVALVVAGALAALWIGIRSYLSR